MINDKKKLLPETKAHTPFTDYVRSEIIKRIDLGTTPQFNMSTFNIAFKPTSLSGAPFSTQHKYRSLDIWSLLHNVVEFVLIPEAHLNGNVHYHGIIINILPGKKKKWYEVALPQLKLWAPRGLNLKIIDNLSEWLDYILKNTEDFDYMKDDYLIWNYPLKYKPEHKKDKPVVSIEHVIFSVKKIKTKKKIQSYVENI